ncbi:Uncharacterised protein [Klebsiella oxytoca]|nr:Uncharacterised protein [Klebsiella oxytoca]
MQWKGSGQREDNSFQKSMKIRAMKLLMVMPAYTPKLHGVALIELQSIPNTNYYPDDSEAEKWIPET